jgi:hypothetical protein
MTRNKSKTNNPEAVSAVANAANVAADRRGLWAVYFQEKGRTSEELPGSVWRGEVAVLSWCRGARGVAAA